MTCHVATCRVLSRHNESTNMRTSSPLRWLPGVLCGCPERLRHLTERLVPQLLAFLAQGCGRPATLTVILTRDLVGRMAPKRGASRPRSPAHRLGEQSSNDIFAPRVPSKPTSKQPVQPVQLRQCSPPRTRRTVGAAPASSPTRCGRTRGSPAGKVEAQTPSTSPGSSLPTTPPPRRRRRARDLSSSPGIRTSQQVGVALSRTSRAGSPLRGSPRGPGAGISLQTPQNMRQLFNGTLSAKEDQALVEDMLFHSLPPENVADLVVRQLRNEKSMQRFMQVIFDHLVCFVCFIYLICFLVCVCFFRRFRTWNKDRNMPATHL